MSQPDERRTLHVIAIIKIAKGILLLLIACAFLFLDRRSELVSGLITWSEEELMLIHGSIIAWLLVKLELILSVTNFRVTGFASLFYAALLLTEGIGVWMQKRWAEWLMVIGTSSLIPLEIYHFLHKPSMTKAVVIIVNVLIALYLARTLTRHKHIPLPNAAR